MGKLVTQIKQKRESVSMSQADLASIVGVRRETIIRLERGQYNPSLKLAVDIANVFGVTVEELFQYIDE